ncbi:MAG: hypothetical protein CR955_00910 [Thiotrichales bacterium]|nr:MAG: hypothetical protein CR955_00910 [Thiotrichales bacterium]
MNNRSSNKKNSGFTLIEMIVTITIVAIFASIAVPSFSNLIKKNRITTSTNEFISSLVLARSEALKRSRDVTVCASDDQTSCSGTEFSKGWIVYADCNGDGSLTAASVDCNGDGVLEETEIVKVHNGLEGVSISNGAADITFKFSGRLGGVASNTAFNIRHKSGTTVMKKVVINRVGRIRAETP